MTMLLNYTQGTS